MKALLNPGIDADLERARHLATLLDAKFQVAGIKFGWEGIIGLIPVVGDTATTLVGLFPIAMARRHKLGLRVQLRMAVNLAIDWLIGLIPVLGDLFDVGFKANLRNLALLEEAAAKKARA